MTPHLFSCFNTPTNKSPRLVRPGIIIAQPLPGLLTRHTHHWIDGVQERFPPTSRSFSSCLTPPSHLPQDKSNSNPPRLKRVRRTPARGRTYGPPTRNWEHRENCTRYSWLSPVPALTPLSLVQQLSNVVYRKVRECLEGYGISHTTYRDIGYR